MNMNIITNMNSNTNTNMNISTITKRNTITNTNTNTNNDTNTNTKMEAADTGLRERAATRQVARGWGSPATVSSLQWGHNYNVACTIHLVQNM